MKSNASILFRDQLHAEHEARKEQLRAASIARVKQRWAMSRRGFLTGMGASALALPAMANTPFTSFSYTVGTETTPLTTPSRIAYDVNVRGFGAVGDAVADDTAAFQNALNAAFAASGGGGSGSGSSAKNTRVIIPPGNYLITSPLYIKNCAGGIIQGWGNGVVNLSWSPTNGAAIPGGGTYTGSGNSLNVAGGQTPCIMTDGCQYMQFNSFGISVPGSPTSPAAVTGIDIYQSSSFGQATANTFRNMNFGYLGQGIIGDGPNGCDNGLMEQCQFSNCSFAGVALSGGNSVNWNSHGGGASNCGLGTGGVGGYNVVNTSSMAVYDTSTTTNKIDFKNATGSAMTIVGGSSESQNIASTTTGPMVITGLSMRMGSSATLLVFDLTGGGGNFLTAIGCWFNCQNAGAGGHIANVVNGSLVLIGCNLGPEIANNCDFLGSGSIFCQSTEFAGTNVNRFASFTGVNVNNIGTGTGIFGTPVAGVTCSGTPTSSFASQGGIVTHC